MKRNPYIAQPCRACFQHKGRREHSWVCDWCRARGAKVLEAIAPRVSGITATVGTTATVGFYSGATPLPGASTVGTVVGNAIKLPPDWFSS